MTPGGLLVITAHPDDEVLIAGGALAACAERGIPTGVACLTRGEEGPIADPALATRETLPRVRMAELHEACRQLGVDWVSCYRWADGSLRWEDAGAIVEELERLMLDHRPAALITFGADGLYYHPDHIATYEFTLQAVTRLPHPPVLYCSAWPAGLMSDLTAALEARGLPADVWGLDPAQFGVVGPDRTDAIEVDVRGQARRKVTALRCHRTQVGAGHAFTTLPDDLAERFLGVERYVPAPEGSQGGWLEETLGAHRIHA